MKKDQMSRLRLDTLQVSSFSPTELVVLGKKVASNVQGCEYGSSHDHLGREKAGQGGHAVGKLRRAGQGGWMDGLMQGSDR